MVTQATLDFLGDLANNNNKDWFEKNKKTYETVYKTEFTPFIQALINATKAFAPEVNDLAKESLFRIYRDTRFSTNKEPYKAYFSAIISKGGKKGMDYPGFYIHLEQGMLQIGGGAYFLEKEQLQKVRHYILLHQTEFLAILENENFIQHFEALKGEKNIRLDADFKAIGDKVPQIFNKQFYVMAELDPAVALAADATEQITTYFKAMQALNDFLVKACF